MNFKTEFEILFNHKHYNAPTGEMYEDDFDWTTEKQENGDKIKVLRKTGKKTNIYEKIQAARELTDIQPLLNEYLQTGNAEILKQKQALYADYKDCPSSIIETMEAQIKAEKTFNSLAPEIRAEFSNSFDTFKESVKDGKIKTKFEKIVKQYEKEQKELQQLYKQQENNNQGVNLNE